MRRIRYIVLIGISVLAALASAAPALAWSGANHNETFLREAS